MDRFGLRFTHWTALGEQAGLRGVRVVAREIGMSPEELDLIVRGVQFPCVSDRSRIVPWLCRKGLAGRAQGDHGDPFRPDGTEHQTRKDEADGRRERREQRQLLASGMLASERD